MRNGMDDEVFNKRNNFFKSGQNSVEVSKFSPIFKGPKYLIRKILCIWGLENVILVSGRLENASFGVFVGYKFLFGDQTLAVFLLKGSNFGHFLHVYRGSNW